MTMMGAMLIYGARNPAVRSLSLIVAGASKAIFGAFVLSGARDRPGSVFPTWAAVLEGACVTRSLEK